MRALRRRLWRTALAAAAAGLLLAAGYAAWYANRPRHPGAEIYSVPPGTSLSAFARTLHERGVIRHPRLMVALAVLRGQGRALKAGEYRFADGATVLEILDQVAAGRVVAFPFAIIEGQTAAQILERLAGAPRMEHSLAGVPLEGLLAALGVQDERHPEGQFYPDTYYYTAGSRDRDLLRRAYDRLQRFLTREWAQRAPDLPLATPYEALILASIVEKETGVAAERPLIAGVFLNRLRRGMKLQTDPTVIYGLGDRYRGNLRLRHLQEDNPFNTYTRAGLPPRPIAVAGPAAIRAVLHPAHTDALYFVARGDGTHEFSATLAEHNRAVERYQRSGRVRNYRSAPPEAAR